MPTIVLGNTLVNHAEAGLSLRLEIPAIAGNDLIIVALIWFFTACSAHFKGLHDISLFSAKDIILVSWRSGISSRLATFGD